MKKWYKIVNQASHTDVYIYDEIGFWGTTAKAFAKEIKAISGDIILHLNSPGGQVFDGLAIYNVLRGHSGSVKTIIEGIAASMASIIALAGDSVEMSENSMYMIHNPLISITGDSEELKKTAGLLDQIKEQLVNIYASHSNLSAEEISDLMDKETWLSAQDALDKGFISSIIPNVPVKNYFVNQFEDNDEYMRFVERQNASSEAWRSQYVEDNSHKLHESSRMNTEFMRENTNKNSKLEACNPNKMEGNMEELLKALGVKSETEAVVKIDAINAKFAKIADENEVLRKENEKLIADAREAKIIQAIAEGKIAPSQKAFASTLIAKEETLFEEFVKANEGLKSKALLNEVDITNSGNPEANGEMTFDKLIEDPEAATNLLKTNPDEYERLKNKYMEDNR